MSLKELGDVSYFRLNNEINRPVNGQIPLHKDQEAVKAFFTENVLPNTKQFDSILDKIAYLLEENYLEKSFGPIQSRIYHQNRSILERPKFPLQVFHGCLQVLQPVCP